MDKLFAWVQRSSAPPSDTAPVSFLADSEEASTPAYQIRIVPALSDNYMYLITSAIEPGLAIAVDPCDAERIGALCALEGLTLCAVLTTHYHADHSGGNAALAERWPNLIVVAGEEDVAQTPAVTRSVSNSETITLAGLPFSVVATPCHTRGHVAYVLDANDGQSPAAFTGDALFVGGCGRSMEGDASHMQNSLQRLCGNYLSECTRIFCGHEYALPNLRFAAEVEPNNPAITQALATAQARVDAGLPTVPSTVAKERDHNPFLRVCEPCIVRACGCDAGTDPCTVMAKLRRKKDTYTPAGKVITFFLDVQNALNLS